MNISDLLPVLSHNEQFELLKIFIDKGTLALIVALGTFIFSKRLEAYKSSLKRSEERSKVDFQRLDILTEKLSILEMAAAGALRPLSEKMRNMDAWLVRLSESKAAIVPDNEANPLEAIFGATEKTYYRKYTEARILVDNTDLPFRGFLISLTDDSFVKSAINAAIEGLPREHKPLSLIGTFFDEVYGRFIGQHNRTSQQVLKDLRESARRYLFPFLAEEHTLAVGAASYEFNSQVLKMTDILTDSCKAEISKNLPRIADAIGRYPQEPGSILPDTTAQTIVDVIYRITREIQACKVVLASKN